MLDEIDKKIINALQEGFPICDSPYRVVAQHLGLTETDLLERLRNLLNTGVLTRFGPLYHAQQMGGALTLAALQVPKERFEEVALIVNHFPEVAHNYERAHVLNMWFVVATETPEQLENVLKQIENQTQLPVFNMPKITEYFVGLKLEA